MKLKYEFEMLNLGQEIVAVPVGEGATVYHGVIKMNDSAARIFQILKNDISEQEIMNILEEEYNTPNEVMNNYMQDVIRQLKENEMLI